MALFNNFPYTDLNDINLDYTLQKLESLYTRGEQLYSTLTTWQQATDAELEQWKAATESSLALWKTQTENSIDNKIQLLTAAINASFTELRTQLEAHIAEIEVTAETAASNASSSAQQALNAASAASINNEQSKEWAIGETLEGDPVPSTNPAYENNAKYYADLLGQETAQIDQNTADITDLKSAIYQEISPNFWGIGAVSASTGAITNTANRWFNTLMLNATIVSSVKVKTDGIDFCISGWRNGVFEGIYTTNNTFAKSWDASLWTNEFDLTAFPEYNFTFVIRSTTDTFTSTDISLVVTSDQLDYGHNKGTKCNTWSKGGYNGNAGDTYSISTSAKRQHILIKDLSLIKKITFATGYSAFPKIADNNNIIQYQVTNGGNDCYIPSEYQTADYNMALTVLNTSDTNISSEEAAAAVTFYLNDITDTSASRLFHYYGDKISLNKHNFNIYLGPVVANASGYHKQGCAAYGDVLVQLFSDNYAQLININTGAVINSYVTSAGHGAGAQFSDEFLSSDDKYPLLYVSPEMWADNSDASEIQVVHITDESWEVIRTIAVPPRSFGGLDLDAKKLIVIKIEKNITGWPKTIYVYDMFREPTIVDNVYTYPLVSTIPIPAYGVQQTCCVHQGILFFLNSDTDGDPYTTKICAIDPYTGRIKTIISDLPSMLSGSSSTSEVEGITVYYDSKFHKNVLFAAPASTATFKIDFDID